MNITIIGSIINHQDTIFLNKFITIEELHKKIIFGCEVIYKNKIEEGVLIRVE
jgi:hypothetical protein